MKKAVVIFLIIGLMVAIAVPSAFAALTSEQQQEMERIQQQITDLEKQMVQKYVEASLITQEQADVMIKNMELRAQYRSQFENSNNLMPGYNGGWGRGMMRGYGAGGYGAGGYGAGGYCWR